MATLEQTTNRRKTISDTAFDTLAIDKIVNMVYNRVENPMDTSQKEVVTILMKTKLSYTTIARVVNEIFPTAHATKNSINQLVRHIKNQNYNVDALLEEIPKDILG